MALENEDKPRYTPTGTVYMEKSITKNLGDHQFAKVTVGMSLPINYTRDDIANAKRTIRKIDTVISNEIESQFDELDA